MEELTNENRKEILRDDLELMKQTVFKVFPGAKIVNIKKGETMNKT